MKSRKQENGLTKVIFSLLLILPLLGSSQTKAPRIYSDIVLEDSVDIFQSKFGQKKQIDSKYKLAILTALRHYPELNNTKILFKRKKIKTTMAARPKGLHVFRSKGKRKYIILINDFSNAEIPADSASFNAQVGIFGHELAHIVEYEQLNSFQVIRIGMKYGNEEFKMKFERNTDLRTIQHGLKWQCYDFAVFAFQYKYASEKYRSEKKKNYMSPEEIESTP